MRHMRAARTLVGLAVALVLCLALYRTSVPSRGKERKQLRSDHSSEELPRLLPCSSKEVPPLTKEEISGIEKFVIFVGYARSGHSIIGSLMDAHPNMIIAHEYMLFNKWDIEDLHGQLIGNRSRLFNVLYQNSYSALCKPKGLRSENKDKKGYTLFVNNSWQAQFKDLKVIGDKGKVGNLYSRDASKVQKSYQEIMETVKVPIHSLHVLRNPFDIMSTALLFKSSVTRGTKYEPTNGMKCNNTASLEKIIDIFFLFAKGVHDMISTCKLTVLEIHSEDFVKQPQGIMKRICDFLGVECSPWYLQMCQDKVFPSVSRSRDRVEWTEEQIARVQKLMNTFPYFKGYNFIRENYDHS